MTKNEKVMTGKIKSGYSESIIEFKEMFIPVVHHIIERKPLGYLIPDRQELTAEVINETLETIKNKQIGKGIDGLLYKNTNKAIKFRMKEFEGPMIERIQKGVLNAFKEFEVAYFPFVLNIIENHKLGDKVQDHLRVARKVMDNSFRYVQNNVIKESLSGLIRTITYRRIADNFGPVTKITEFQLDKTYHSPEEELIQGEEIEEQALFGKWLKHCLEQLTKTQQIVLDLWTQCHSWAEIARMRGVTAPAINQIKEPAFKRLRGCVNGLRGI